MKVGDGGTRIVVVLVEGGREKNTVFGFAGF
jgi:hypothetical protein